jgi:hypothetical protein
MATAKLRIFSAVEGEVHGEGGHAQGNASLSLFGMEWFIEDGRVAEPTRFKNGGLKTRATTNENYRVPYETASSRKGPLRCCA